jgi:hypothetical protein
MNWLKRLLLDLQEVYNLLVCLIFIDIYSIEAVKSMSICVALIRNKALIKGFGPYHTEDAILQIIIELWS